MTRPEKRYIQRHVREHGHPKRLPTVEDLQKLYVRIDKQMKTAEGQIALTLDDSERLGLSVILLAIRSKQEELGLEIDRRIARREQKKGETIGDFQPIGLVLAKMNGEERPDERVE